MADLVVLTDDTLDAHLRASLPVVLLLGQGDGVRSDFLSAMRRVAGERRDLVLAQMDPAANPRAAARYEAGSRPLLLVLAGQQVLARRARPWASDLALALSELAAWQAAHPAPKPGASAMTPQQDMTMTSEMLREPVHVTDATFADEVVGSALPVLVDFWAEWCGPCRMVGPVLDKLAAEYAGRVKIAKVDVDTNPNLSAQFQIRSIPNLMAVKNRTIVFNQPGAPSEPQLRQLLDQLIALDVPTPPSRQPASGQ